MHGENFCVLDLFGSIDDAHNQVLPKLTLKTGKGIHQLDRPGDTGGTEKGTNA